MSAIWHTVLGQLDAMSAAELLAVVLAVAYLLLVIRQNIWCWACAGISSAIYVAVFIDARLYMESLLYLFYVLMAIYGWQVWRSGGGKDDTPVAFWRARLHAVALGVIALLATASGWLLDRYTNAAFPYIDSLTTFAAVFATYLVVRRVFDNWWYWLVIDIASIAIYWSRGLELTSLLFIVYVGLIPLGMRQWRASVTQVPGATRGICP